MSNNRGHELLYRVLRNLVNAGLAQNQPDALGHYQESAKLLTELEHIASRSDFKQAFPPLDKAAGKSGF